MRKNRRRNISEEKRIDSISLDFKSLGHNYDYSSSYMYKDSTDSKIMDIWCEDHDMFFDFSFLFNIPLDLGNSFCPSPSKILIQYTHHYKPADFFEEFLCLHVYILQKLSLILTALDYKPM